MYLALLTRRQLAELQSERQTEEAKGTYVTLNLAWLLVPDGLQVGVFPKLLIRWNHNHLKALTEEWSQKEDEGSGRVEENASLTSGHGGQNGQSGRRQKNGDSRSTSQPVATKSAVCGDGVTQHKPSGSVF